MKKWAETLELSPSKRKPELGQYRTGIDCTGIQRSQNLILEAWKAERGDSISCIHSESHNVENISVSFREKSQVIHWLGCDCLREEFLGKSEFEKRKSFICEQ